MLIFQRDCLFWALSLFLIESGARVCLNVSVSKDKKQAVLLIWLLVTTFLSAYGFITPKEIMNTAQILEALKTASPDEIAGLLEIVLNSSFSLLQKSVSYIVTKVGSYYCLQNGETGKLDQYSTNDDEIIQTTIDSVTNSGGAVLIKPASYSASIVLLDKVRLIIEKGATGIIVGIEPSATCVIEDWQNGRTRYYKDGALTMDIDHASGKIQCSYGNFTNLYIENMDESTTNSYVRLLKLIIQSGTSFPSNPVTGFIFFRLDYNMLTIYNGTAWLNVTGTGEGEGSPPEGGSPLDVYDTFINDLKIASANNLYINTTGGYVSLIIPTPNSNKTWTNLGLFGWSRKTLSILGGSWVFHISGVDYGKDIIYETSINGTWNYGGLIYESSSSIHFDSFDVHFDGTYLHFAIVVDRPNDIYYRRGLPNYDASITWSDDWQTVSTIYHDAFYPLITTDVQGYPFIGYQDNVDVNGRPYIIKAQYNNGTWGTTPSPFPYQLSSTTDDYWIVRPIGLPVFSSYVYVIYARGGQYPLGRMWASTYFQSEESDITDYTLPSGYPKFSVVDSGTGAATSKIHFIYVRSSTYDLRYNIRSFVETPKWQANDELVEAGVGSSTHPSLCIDKTTGTLYCFWAKTSTDHVYYQTGTSGDWTDDVVDWIDESAEQIPVDRVTSFYESYNGKIGVIYFSNTSQPFNIKFNWLEIEDTIGILYSTNLLVDCSVFSIDQFNYTCTIPVSATLKILFSQNNATWYNSSGGSVWQSLSEGTNNTINLSGLIWSGPNFYYKIQFANSDDSTPILDYIAVIYTEES